MRSLFLFLTTITLFPGMVAAKNATEIKIVDRPAKQAFYRVIDPNEKKKTSLAEHMNAFSQSVDLYKIKRNQKIFLIVDGSSKAIVGVGMELIEQDDKIPANKIHTMPAGKYVSFTSIGKGGTPKQHQSENLELKKFLDSKKLKLRGNNVYVIMPITKSDKAPPVESLMPVQ